jgi:hypothetical protein
MDALRPAESLEALRPLESLEAFSPLESLEALRPLESLEAFSPLEPEEESRRLGTSTSNKVSKKEKQSGNFNVSFIKSSSLDVSLSSVRVRLETQI